MALLKLDSSMSNLTMTSEAYSEVNQKNGFECPTCGEELEDDGTSGLLESMPQQKKVVCKCGFSGRRFVAN